jgi:predicted enzyme involved in methoxymalonyl-ACP biosynthesis
VRCVVIEPDNVLWGGMIGEDGAAGIKLDAYGEGAAFHRVQAYLKGLADRGVLLAVASRTEMENVLAPFESHPRMLLKREDISVFLANWNDQAENIRTIRETLRIGPDSMLFLDADPFERNLVRSLMPEVIVPELPEDPAEYVRAISEQPVFGDADAFLESLDMRLEVARFERMDVPCITELIQRSSQFSLTARRYTEVECEALMSDPALLPLCARLSDRLGDYGLIGVIVLSAEGEEMVIRDWLMSCRVLARGVEQQLMNLVVEEAQRRGCTRVSGEYIRTSRNGMVSEFFAQFGFTMIGDDPDHTLWVLPVQAYEPVPTFIRTAAAMAGPCFVEASQNCERSCRN